MRMEAWHERMVALVDRMLELNKRKRSGSVAAIPRLRDRRNSAVEHSSTLQLERDIAATDAEIDRLVYDLYPSADGTAEEIALVEGQAHEQTPGYRRQQTEYKGRLLHKLDSDFEGTLGMSTAKPASDSAS